MNIDDVIISQVDDAGEKCAVCGKSVSGSSAYARISYEKQIVALCCPLCLQTFHENPQKFARRQAIRAELHALFILLTPPE